MKNITRAGVDVAKSVFHIHAKDRHGQKIWQAKLTRNQWLKQISQHLAPGSEIAMEACGGPHHWARELQRMG
jgi:transposase